MDSTAMPSTQDNSTMPEVQNDQPTNDFQEGAAIESSSSGALSNDDEQTSLSRQTTPDSQACPTESTGSSKELPPDKRMALVTVKQPGPVKHETAAWAYNHIMSGRLFYHNGGVVFIPSAPGGKAWPWHMKGEIHTTDFYEDGVDTQEQLEEARQFLKDSGSGVPKFLFRGFNANSGGGFDPRLNGRDGVVPHAFLDVPNQYQNGETLNSMWQMPADEIYGNMTCHIEYERDLESPFSSWTHFLQTALRFAHTDNTSMIAVLDTTHASLVDRVWHTEDLRAAGLTEASFMDEFLVYGPVSGPNYHCISVQKLLRTTRILEIMFAPVHMFRNDRIGVIERRAVKISRRIATVLQPRGARLENIVTLTARFIGVRVARSAPGLRQLRYKDLNGFLYFAREDLQDLAMRPGARDISLADQSVNTFFSNALDFEVQILQAAENAVRVLAWNVRAVISSALSATDPDSLEDVSDQMQLVLFRR